MEALYHHPYRAQIDHLNLGLGKNPWPVIQWGILRQQQEKKFFAGWVDHNSFYVDSANFWLGNSPRQDGLDWWTRNDSAGFKYQSTPFLRPVLQVCLPTYWIATYVIGVWASASRRAVSTLKKTDNMIPVATGWNRYPHRHALTNEAVIPIGYKDLWNRMTPYQEFADNLFYSFFYNPELALYMDDDLFGGAVPSFSAFAF